MVELVELVVVGLAVVQPVVVSGHGRRVLRTILRLSFGDRVEGHLDDMESCRSGVVAGAEDGEDVDDPRGCGL
jgi:hypothetical protein